MKITGQYLIDLGFKPSKWFKEALTYLNNNDLTEEATITYLNEINEVNKTNFIPLNENPVPYHLNIRTENKEEENNLASVIASMDVLMKTPTIIGGCIMPDACPTGGLGDIPVGGLVITDNSIFPGFHSSDICCSVTATNLGIIDHKTVMDIAFNTTQFGQGGRKEHGGWSNLLYDNKVLKDKILDNYFTQDYFEKACMHLGTQGDGNHFLFIGTSENTRETYLVTHHGSRGFGASVYKKGMIVADSFRKKLSPNTLKKNAWIPYEEMEGKLYWEALQIIREWTKLNHYVIHDKICHRLKIQYKDRFWNEHNFVFKDNNKFYHAKGVTPLDNKFVPDSINGLRLIPLNMGQPILVVKGETTTTNFGFAPHGAGRNLSRTAHANKNKLSIEKVFEKETKGLDVRFFSGLIDIAELPSAYKDANSIQQSIKEFGLGEVIDRILPYGSIMAGLVKTNK